MPQLTIPKDVVVDVYDLPFGGTDTVEVLDDTIYDSGRWSIHHKLTVRVNGYPDVGPWAGMGGKVYQTTYSVGATEQQDEQPWQYEDVVTFTEVRSVRKFIDVWEIVPE